MQNGVPYTFTAAVWQYEGNGGWHFVSLPKEVSSEIRQYFQAAEEGWGRLKATARIGQSEWLTAIWFDTKKGTYLLPLKAAIRKQEHITNGQYLTVTIWV
ncbi:MAG: DUF1905 domain-containing protein [Saprospiraceae bacterium]